MQHSDKTLTTIYVNHMCETYVMFRKTHMNLRLKKQMKHLEQIVATYVYSHCNICNIYMKHLQHTF
jgi:hypothetical protein